MMREQLAELVQKNEQTLNDLPHPFSSWADKGHTLLRYSHFILKFGNGKSLLKLQIKLKKAGIV